MQKDDVQKIVIKQAGLEDLELLSPLFDEYRVFYQQESDLNGARAFLEERLRLEESVILLAVEEAGGQRRGAGYTQLYPSFSSVSLQRLWILNDLYVNEKFRGVGIGSRLLESAREYAMRTGSKGLTLTTATDNTAAQHLYESNGYIRDEDFYTYDLFFQK
ncbi:GNAT family N-acetyltransferase [Paenibacillus sp. NPDC057934]|uniref:GNAT family N-acetyltransferase n=1 Tax=Paenibacillus sp. NPDC057934 TaxID=3346282 RepID=UPI0036D85FC4